MSEKFVGVPGEYTRADIEQLVVAEVERALKWFLEPGVQSVASDQVRNYLAARFGETAPEWHQEPDFVPGLPTPSAPAVIGLEGGRLTTSPVYTDAERDFLLALCEERVAAANIPATMAYYPGLQQKLNEASEAVVAAAKRVVEAK